MVMFATYVAGAGRNVGVEAFAVFVKAAIENICVCFCKCLGVCDCFEGEPHGSGFCFVVLMTDEVVAF